MYNGYAPPGFPAPMPPGWPPQASMGYPGASMPPQMGFQQPVGYPVYPFAPGFSPPPGQYASPQAPYGMGAQSPMMPAQGSSTTPQQQPPPRHAGIGAMGQAPNIQPSNAPAPSPYGKPSQTGEKFSLFVSNIADGLEDFWLERFLNATGPLVQMKRPKDPSGKPKAFAFVDYGDLDSVRRCLDVVNNLSLRGKDGVIKQLNIKADDKVRAKLDEHESNRMPSDHDSELAQYAQNTIKDILEQMGDPEMQKLADASMIVENHIQRRAPNHLQDLGPEDLPKESRGLITSEIAFFRQRVFEKEGPKDGRSELEKVRGVTKTVIGQLHDPNRVSKVSPTKETLVSRAPPNAPAGPAAERAQGSPDPQSLNKPVPFVKGGAVPAVDADPAATDEEREKRRQEAKRREQELIFRDRERKWEQRERQRQSAFEREKQRERQQDIDEERQATQMRRHLAEFDDEREVERKKDLYYSDRDKWRSQRQVFRRREMEEDERDAELEQHQMSALKRESEAFLSQQADFFAKMTSKTGASLDDTTHIKLSLGPAKREAIELSVPLPRAGAFNAAEDEEDATKKKRALVPLTYEGVNEDEVELGMTDEQKLEQRKAKVRELVESIPMDREGLWSYDIQWDQLSELAISEKLAPFIQKKCVEVLGMEDDDLVSTVLDHVRAHKSAAELTAELEQILDTEAEPFVVKIWRFVIFESLAAQHNIQTST